MRIVLSLLVSVTLVLGDFEPSVPKRYFIDDILPIYVPYCLANVVIVPIQFLIQRLFLLVDYFCS